MKNMKKSTKSAEIYEKLKKMAVAGQFSQGHTWSLRKLAGKFGTSVPPVTEAVRRLEQDGILIVHPQRGISLKYFSVQELRQVNVIREGMEIQAARIAAKNADKHVLESLMETARDIVRLIGDNKPQEAAFSDFKLHQQIIEASGIEMLTEKYGHLVTICMIAQGGWDMSCFKYDVSGEATHIKLVEAICSGDPDKAEKAVRQHIQSEAS